MKRRSSLERQVAFPSRLLVAFTGHRPDKVGGYKEPNPTANWVKAQLKTLLRKLKPTGAISGMAIGVDQWGAELCLDLGIPFIAAVPFLGQENLWPAKAQERYRWLLERADEIRTISNPGYAAWKMQLRNRWMVDNCDRLIAVWDGSAGGTANCVRYAEDLGKPITRIDPSRRSWDK